MKKSLKQQRGILDCSNLISILGKCLRHFLTCLKALWTHAARLSLMGWEHLTFLLWKVELNGSYCCQSFQEPFLKVLLPDCAVAWRDKIKAKWSAYKKQTKCTSRCLVHFLKRILWVKKNKYRYVIIFVNAVHGIYYYASVHTGSQLSPTV